MYIGPELSVAYAAIYRNRIRRVYIETGFSPGYTEIRGFVLRVPNRIIVRVSY